MNPGGQVAQQLPNNASCNGSTRVSAFPSVNNDSGDVTSMVVSWTGFASGSAALQPDGRTWYGQIGPISYTGKPNDGGTLAIRVTASNGRGSTQLNGSPITVLKCTPPGTTVG